MTVICEEVDQTGKVIRRCDARCYNAKGQDCECMCDGDNHGKGFIGAVLNVTDNGSIEKANERLKEKGTQARLRSFQIAISFGGDE